MHWVRPSSEGWTEVDAGVAIPTLVSRSHGAVTLPGEARRVVGWPWWEAIPRSLIGSWRKRSIPRGALLVRSLTPGLS